MKGVQSPAVASSSRARTLRRRTREPSEELSETPAFNRVEGSRADPEDSDEELRKMEVSEYLSYFSSEPVFNIYRVAGRDRGETTKIGCVKEKEETKARAGI